MICSIIGLICLKLIMLTLSGNEKPVYIFFSELHMGQWALYHKYHSHWNLPIPLLGHSAVQGNQSHDTSKGLIHPNWQMTRSIWNWCPSGMALPPLLPSEWHRSLICVNLINTLTVTPGLFSGGCVAAVVPVHRQAYGHTHTHDPPQMGLW